MTVEIKETIETRDTVQSLNQLVKDMDNAREKLKAQAFVNVMFLYGNHHFKISRRRGFDNIDDIIAYEVDRYFSRQRIKRTCNYILPLYRSLVSRIIRMKAHIHAEPTTSTSDDKDVARVSKMVCEDFWQNVNRNNQWLQNEYSGMQSIVSKLTTYLLTLGCGYLEPYFNPNSKTLLYDESSKQIFEAEAGEVEMRIHHMLNVYRDRYNRFTIVRRRISAEQVYDEFGVDVPPDSAEYDSTIDCEIERALYGDVYGDRNKQDGVWISTKYCNPSREYPRGHLFVCSEKNVLFDDDLPQEYKLKNPVVEFRYQDLGFSGRGQGAIEQVVDLQQDLNFTLTRISQYKKLLTGKLMIPKGSKINTQWDSEVGQIITYNHGFKPEYEHGAQVPAYLFEELSRIQKNMEDLMTAHDSSMGKNPNQVKSGVGIQNLAEIDNSMISPELISLEQKLGYTMEMVLNIAEWKYSERRLLTISGDDLGGEVKSFIGSDLIGQKKVRIRMGSGMPDDIQSRAAYIDALVQKGYLKKERAMELMELGDIDGIWRSIDETAAKTDIMNIIEGNMQVVAEPWEDAATRLKVINDFRKGSKYAMLPDDKKQQINQLADGYQQMLSQETDAAMQMQAKQAAAIATATEQAKSQGEVVLAQAKAQGAVQVATAKAQAEKKPPFEAINYKDVPPTAKLSMLTQAGIEADPKEILIDHLVTTAGANKKPAAPKQGASNV